jgi:hypothetical protein
MVRRKRHPILHVPDLLVLGFARFGLIQTTHGRVFMTRVYPRCPVTEEAALGGVSQDTRHAFYGLMPIAKGVRSWQLVRDVRTTDLLVYPSMSSDIW